MIDKKTFAMAQLDIEAFNKANPVIHFEITSQMAWAVLSALQVALLHPKVQKSPVGILAEGMARQLQYRLCKTEATVMLAEAGWKGEIPS